MKKQLLIAAVAATMSSVAMADISITGSMDLKIADNGTSTQNLDLAITGKADAGTVVAKMDNVQTGSLSFNEAYVTTSVEGLTVKAGTWEGQTGNGLTFDSSAAKTKLTVSTSVAGVSIAHHSNDTTDVSGSFAGVSVKMQDALNSSRTTSIATDIAGVAVTAEKNDDTTAYSLAGSVAGMTVTYVNVDATATQADGIIGNIAGKTGVSGINVKADTAAGAVEVKSHTSDTTDVTTVSLQRGIVKYSYNDSTEAFQAQVKFSF